jgi:hypothetical protein
MKTPYILCAAIWYKELPTPKYNPVNVDKGIVLCGHRHVDVMHQMKALTGKRSVENECGKYVQGFITNENEFVDRVDAAKIAVSANQIIQPFDPTCLYSEDLY